MAKRGSAFRGRPSTGCEACRKRKVKCDEGRPGCQKCKVHQIVCPGYRDQVQIWFRDQTTEIVQKSLEEGSIVKESSAKRHQCSRELQIPAAPDAGDALTRSFVFSLAVSYCIPERYIFSRVAAPGRFDSLRTIGWYSGTWSPTSYVVAALAFGRCGRVTGDKEMSRKGFDMYQKAVGSIRKALCNKKTTFNVDTISAVGFMALYEALEDPTGQRALAHSAAFVNLVRLLGPEAMSDNTNFNIFCTCRTHAAVQALAQRKSSFFFQSNWMDVPWSAVGRTKTYYQRGIDLVLELCSLLEQQDIIDSTAESFLSPSHSTKRLELQLSMLQLRDKFVAWQTVYELEFLPPWYAIDDEWSSPASASSTPPIFTPLRFIDYLSFETYILYWSSRLILNKALQQNNMQLKAEWLPVNDIEAGSEFPFFSFESMELPPEYEILDTAAEDFMYACSIASSMEYCLEQSPDNGVFGVGPIIAPFHLALEYFESAQGCQDKVDWCHYILKLLPVIQGNQLYHGLKITEVAIRGDKPCVEFSRISSSSSQSSSVSNNSEHSSPHGSPPVQTELALGAT